MFHCIHFVLNYLHVQTQKGFKWFTSVLDSALSGKINSVVRLRDAYGYFQALTIYMLI